MTRTSCARDGWTTSSNDKHAVCFRDSHPGGFQYLPKLNVADTKNLLNFENNVFKKDFSYSVLRSLIETLLMKNCPSFEVLCPKADHFIGPANKNNKLQTGFTPRSYDEEKLRTCIYNRRCYVRGRRN